MITQNGKQKLIDERRKIRKSLSRYLNLYLIGSVVEYHLTCGKKNCKCKKGETVNFYILKNKLEKARKMSANYRKIKELLWELSRLNLKLLKLRDSNEGEDK